MDANEWLVACRGEIVTAGERRLWVRELGGETATQISEPRQVRH